MLQGSIPGIKRP